MASLYRRTLTDIVNKLSIIHQRDKSSIPSKSCKCTVFDGTVTLFYENRSPPFPLFSYISFPLSDSSVLHNLSLCLPLSSDITQLSSGTFCNHFYLSFANFWILITCFCCPLLQCRMLALKFAGSNLAEDNGFQRAIKTLAWLSSRGK